MSHPRESPPLLFGDFIPLRAGAATNFRRQAAIVASCSERSARSITLPAIVRPPFLPVINTLLADD